MMESLPDASQKFVQYLLDYIFPPCCAACQRRGTILCPSCIAQVRPVPAPYYQQCHTPRTNNTTCRNCRYDPLHFNGLRVMSSYTGPLRTCIRALKYQGQKRLAGPLGTLLAQAYATYQLQADLIVPVPLHTERIKQRGYNQSQLLAKVCATQLHVPLETSLLTRVRPTAAQVNLKPSERQRNVANAFRCTSPSSIQMVKGKRIVLIDDVCTTGATRGACAAPLFAAGAQSVWGLVLARPL